MVVRWTSDSVRIDAARPEQGYDMKIRRNGPDKVIVTFVNVKEKGGSLVEASPRDNGDVTEYQCRGQWGTESWDCNERR